MMANVNLTQGGVHVPFKNIFTTVSGVHRKVTDMYTTVSGVHRKISLSSYNPVLENNTWEQIAEASESGVASTIWQIGDTKDVILDTGEILTFQIYDFDHDNLSNGTGTAGITFGMRHLMATQKALYKSNSISYNDFFRGDLHTWLVGAFKSSLPVDLQSVLKTVLKWNSTGGTGSTLCEFETDIFLPSEIECTGTNSLSASGEGFQYPVFSAEENRVKKLSNGSGKENHWWTRSRRWDGITVLSTFICMNGTTVSARQTNLLGGVCPAFCI